MLSALSRAGGVPCLVPSEREQSPERFAAPWQQVRKIWPRITRSAPRGVLRFLRHFFPRTGNLLQIIPIGKFSGCGAGLRPAGSRSLWLSDSGGVGTSSLFPLPSPISHPSCILYTESSESFSCILYTEFSESWTAASLARMVDGVRVTKNNDSSLPGSLAPCPASHLWPATHLNPVKVS